MIRRVKRLVHRLAGRPDLVRDAARLLGPVPGRVVFDVGANVGQTAAEVLAAFRHPHLTCFEPGPAFATLESRFRGLPGVSLENAALGDAPGELPLHVGNYTVNDSLLRPTYQPGAVTPVRVQTLDGYCAARGIARIDLLKIDTQGYDLRVLAGAAGLFAAGAIPLFAVEAICNPMYEGQAQPSELFAFGEGHGYRVVGLYPAYNWGERMTSFDVLFAAPSKLAAAPQRAPGGV